MNKSDELEQKGWLKRQLEEVKDWPSWEIILNKPEILAFVELSELSESDLKFVGLELSNGDKRLIIRAYNSGVPTLCTLRAYTLSTVIDNNDNTAIHERIAQYIKHGAKAYLFSTSKELFAWLAED